MPARGYKFYLRVFNLRYRVEHVKIKFVSTNGNVIFCLLYKHTRFRRFSEDFRPLSEDFQRFFKILPKARRTFLNMFRRLPKIIEDFGGRPDDVLIVQQHRLSTFQEIM